MQEVEKPVLQAGEVLVKVKAISINPVDFKVREFEAALNAIVGTVSKRQPPRLLH